MRERRSRSRKVKEIILKREFLPSKKSV